MSAPLLAIKTTTRDRAHALLATGEKQALLEAAKLFFALDDASAEDLASGAYALCLARQWKRARIKAREALTKGASAWTIWVYATALIGSRNWSKLEDDALTIFRLMEFATRLPQCPPSAFLFVDDYIVHQQSPASNARETLLQRGVSAHPLFAEIRHRYAEVIRLRSGDSKRVLEILSPLLAGSDALAKALWLAAICNRELGQTREALDCLRRFSLGVEKRPVAILAFEASLLGDLDARPEALTLWNEVSRVGSESEMVIARFGRAKLHLDSGSAWAAVAEIRPVLEECFVAPHKYAFLKWKLAKINLPNVPNLEITEVAARLAVVDSTPDLTTDEAARLAVVALEGGVEIAAKALRVDPVDAVELLLEVARPIEHDGRYFEHLSRYHAARGDWPLAVRAYLRKVDLAAGKLGSPPETCVVDVPWHALKSDELVRVHRELVNFAAQCTRPTVDGELCKFYGSGWHSSLMAARLLIEAAEASNIVNGHQETEAAEAAAFGYQEYVAGRIEEAIRWTGLSISWGGYEHLAHHNLSLLLQKQGATEEAESIRHEVKGCADFPENEVVRVLTRADQDRTFRQQAESLATAKEYGQAARRLLAIPQPTEHDLCDAAWYFGQAGDWDEAQEMLGRVLKEERRAWALCYMAVTIAKGRRWYEWSESERAAQRDRLEEAIELPGCPLWGFEDLEELYRTDYSDPLSLHRSEAVLRAAHDAHPAASGPRLRLAWPLINGRIPNYTAALELVLPLADSDEPNAAACWIASLCLRRQEESGEALEYIARLESILRYEEQPLGGVIFTKADLLFELGHTGDAIALLDELIHSRDQEESIQGLLIRAYFKFEEGASESALEDLEEALRKWLEHEELLNVSSFIVSGKGGLYTECGQDELLAACDSFLHPGERHRLDDLTYGRLLWLRFWHSDEASDGREKWQGRRRLQLVEEAVRLAPDPRFHARIWPAYAREGIWDRTLHHLLLDRIYRFEKALPLGWDPGSLDYYSDSLETAAVSHLRKLHTTFLELLNEHKNASMTKSVFLPVFVDPLYRLLWKSNLWHEAREAAHELAELVSDDSTPLFVEAYSAAKLGLASDAEELYTRLLAQWPENATGLNNLAVIFEQSGRTGEALQMYERAAQLAPSTELYANNAAGLRDRIKRLEAVGNNATPLGTSGNGSRRSGSTEQAQSRSRIAENYRLPAEVDLSVDCLSLRDALYLLCVVRCAGSEDDTHIIPIGNVDVGRLSPSRLMDEEIVGYLYNARLLRVHPDSQINAFVFSNESPNQFYTMKVSWALCSDPGSSREFITQVEEVFRTRSWPAEWYNQWQPLWRAVALEECLQYLVFVLDEHDLPFTPGPKTRAVLGAVLESFSTAQAFSFIWRAAKDAAALQVREQLAKPHAANTVVASIQRSAERALAEGWQVAAYRRDRRLPQSSLSQVLYDTVLNIGQRGFTEIPGQATLPHVDERDDVIG